LYRKEEGVDNKQKKGYLRKMKGDHINGWMNVWCCCVNPQCNVIEGNLGAEVRL
jgi:hypothetical protein